MKDGTVIPLNPRYNWIRARSLEGTLPGGPDVGTYLISSNRIGYGWGSVPLAAWPLSDEWPPNEPPGLDKIAKDFRILFYQTVRSLSDCKIALDAPTPVIAAFEITKQWFAAPQGAINLPEPNDEVIGSHAITLLGINPGGKTIKFVNSWGDEWGDRGFGYLPIEYFDQQFVCAWVMEILQRDDTATDRIQHLDLGFRGPLGANVHVREIYDPSRAL